MREVGTSRVQAATPANIERIHPHSLDFCLIPNNACDPVAAHIHEPEVAWHSHPRDVLAMDVNDHPFATCTPPGAPMAIRGRVVDFEPDPVLSIDEHVREVGHEVESGSTPDSAQTLQLRGPQPLCEANQSILDRPASAWKLKDSPTSASRLYNSNDPPEPIGEDNGVPDHANEQMRRERRGRSQPAHAR